MKRISFTIVFLLSLLFYVSSSFPASKLLDEDFDSATYIDASGGDTALDFIRTACTGGDSDLTTDNPSPDSGNNSLRCHVCASNLGGCGSDRTNLNTGINVSSLTEIYIKYYFYIDSNLTGELQALKHSLITSSSDGYYPSGAWATMSHWANGGLLGYGSWAATSEGCDPGDWSSHGGYVLPFSGIYDTWVKMELYHNFGANIFRLWIDDVLKWECLDMSYTISPNDIDSVTILHHAYVGAAGSQNGYIQIDDIEVWDGMPTDVTAPTMSSATIASNGTTLTLVYDEAVSQGAGYNDADIDLDATSGGNDIGATYSSGDTTTTHIYTIGQVIQVGDTVNLDFNGDANSLEDGSSNDLAAITDGSVTNNSIQPEITIAATDGSAAEEGQATGTFRITASSAVVGNLVVSFTLGGTALEASDVDEDLSGGTVTILDTNTFVDQTITPKDDSDVEGEENLTMTIAADSYTIGSPSQAEVIIADNELVEGEAGAAVLGSGTGAMTAVPVNAWEIGAYIYPSYRGVIAR